MRMLFKLAQQTTGLHFLIEPLQRGIDRLVRLNGYVNQTWAPSSIMAHSFQNGEGLWTVLEAQCQGAPGFSSP